MLWLLIIGAVFMLVGAFGVYMTTISPIQLQPIPAILFAIGFVMAVFSAGAMLT